MKMVPRYILKQKRVLLRIINTTVDKNISHLVYPIYTKVYYTIYIITHIEIYFKLPT